MENNNAKSILKKVLLSLLLIAPAMVFGQSISYQWSTGDTTANFQANPTQTTTYYVTVTQYGVSYVDSVTIVVNHPNASADTVVNCNTYTWPVNSQTYTSSGVYLDTLVNAFNCDSVVTLQLTIHNSTTGTDMITACDSYTWPTTGLTYSNSGTYLDTLQNIFGCDSVVTLNLTINNSNTGTDVITACDSYTWIDGNTYTASNNTATHTLQNVNGCDSVVTLNLTINQSTASADTALGVGKYIWPLNGDTLTTSGQYLDTIANAKGCDSVITLDLTIVPPLIVNAGVSDSVICEGGAVTVGVTTSNFTFSPSSADSIFNNNKSYGFVIDNEGNTYRTIQIGSQVWMAENLRSTQFQNGDPIPNLTDSSNWDSVTYAAFSKYINPNQNYYYGNLYNFYAANDSRNICPVGWHVPRHSDFISLIGGAFVNPTGGSFKSISNLWIAPNVSATNSTGFSALPGGSRNSNGGFYGVGSSAAFWSRTQYNSEYAWGMFLSNANNDASRYGGNPKNSGYNIRCIKD